MEEKIEELELSIARWEKEQPTCEKGVSLRLTVIENLKESIEKLIEIKNASIN